MRPDGSSDDSNNNYLQKFTIVVLGDSKVGKSALVARFLGQEFEEKHHPTVEEFYVKHVSYKDRTCELQIIDTSGTYEFPAMRRVDIMKADGVVLVYSMDQPNSFDRLERYLTEVLENKKSSSLPIVIVSNKSDIPGLEERRMRDGRGLFVNARHHMEMKWGCPCLEASAKTKDNVEELFLKLLRQLSGRKQLPHSSPRLRRPLSTSLLQLGKIRFSK